MNAAASRAQAVPREAAPLAPFTTFRIGGPARAFLSVSTDDEVRDAIASARDRVLPLLPLGGGSNILVPDEGVDALVARAAMIDITPGSAAAGRELLIAGAGARWDDVVDAAAARGLWGIENLAGVPGTAGGAAVQNIGAYGAELSSTFAFAEAIDLATGELERIDRAQARFGYRTSAFKDARRWYLVRVALSLDPHGTPNLSYGDLSRARDAGEPLGMPAEIARAVRAIRAKKFPRPGAEGTAGSFFKNPVLPVARTEALAARYRGLPVFPQGNGTAKVPLAWLLDHALGMKGFALGRARLFEAQPLVIVAEDGATAREVDELAREVARRVRDAIGIDIEREVETFGARQ